MMSIHLAGHYLDLHSKEVFKAASRPIEVVGPILLEESVAIHKAYWK